MRISRLRWVAVLLAATATLLAGCGGGGGGDGTDAQPAAATITEMNVQVQGDTGGAAPEITITAPDGSATKLTGSQRLTGLAPGRYGISAATIMVGSTPYSASVVPSEMTIPTFDPNVTVTYGRFQCTQKVTQTVYADHRSANNGLAYGDTGGGASGGGGDAGGGDGGGSEGKFSNALVEIFIPSGATASGLKIGEATTDPAGGLFTFTLCDHGGPVKFVLRGKPGGVTKYFDEARNSYQVFTENDELIAVIPKFENRNVGLSFLTTGAYRLLEVEHGPSGWIDPVKVTDANNRVRDEINRFLPASMQIADITRLPWIIGDATETPANSIPDSLNAILGTVISGIMASSGNFRGDASSSTASASGSAVPKALAPTTDVDTRPARAMSSQLALDLSDGKIDLFYKDPATREIKPVLEPTSPSDNNPAARATYNPTQFGEFINAGISRINADKRIATSQNRALRFTQVTFVQDSPSSIYDARTPMFLLREDGAVYFWPARTAPIVKVESGFRTFFPRAGADIDPVAGGDTGVILGSKLDGRGFYATVVFPNVDEQRQGVLPRVRSIVERAGMFRVTRIDGVGTGAAATFGEGHVRRYVDAHAEATAASGIANVPNLIDVQFGRGELAKPIHWGLQADGSVWVAGNARPATAAARLDLAAIANPRITAIAGGLNARLFMIDTSNNVFRWDDVQNPPAPVKVDQWTGVSQIQCANFGACVALTRTGAALADTGKDLFDTYLPAGTIPRGTRVIYLGATLFTVYGILSDGRVFVLHQNEKQQTVITLIDLASAKEQESLEPQAPRAQ